MDEQEFRRLSDEAIEDLKRSLYEAEGEADFEAEDNAGALHISFEDPPGKFVISPNSPARQIWISALSTSFKLDWSDEQERLCPDEDRRGHQEAGQSPDQRATGRASHHLEVDPSRRRHSATPSFLP